MGRGLEETDLEDGAVRDCTRVLVDALGKLEVLADTYYGAATRRAIQNLRFSDRRFSRRFIWAHATIKSESARVNGSVGLLATSARSLADNVIHDFEVDEERCRYLLERNGTLVTALTPRVGYEVAASIAAESIQSGRSVLEVAMESTEIAEDKLRELLDAWRVTGGGRDMSSRPHT